MLWRDAVTNTLDRTAVWVVLGWLFAVSCTAADWPMYGRDPRRSSATSENLEFPLATAWTYEPSQSPCPAWPELMPLT